MFLLDVFILGADVANLGGVTWFDHKFNRNQNGNVRTGRGRIAVNRGVVPLQLQPVDISSKYLALYFSISQNLSKFSDWNLLNILARTIFSGFMSIFSEICFMTSGTVDR